ncbi:MAG: FHA domain-containing protein [Acidobacteria bacterium]|nr:FHA domain-containing protein [Acidobacteriota bacterium]
MLAPLTEEARHALGGAEEVPIACFPFRVGRDTGRTRPGTASIDAGDAGGSGTSPENDVCLIETSGHARHVSSRHFAIEREDGQFFLVDRGSACGTIVSGRRIGGNREGGRAQLRDGDEIIVGTSRSRYAFRFAVLHHES